MKVHSEQTRKAVIAKIEGLDLLKHAWDVSGKPWKEDRSLAQNRLAFMWYAELGKQSQHGKDHERNYCKWTYGCPIVAEVDSDFSEFYGKLMDNYDYEQCLAAMEFVQVTSLMKVKQFAEYLNHIELYAGEQGYIITRPEDLYDAAIGLTRDKPECQK